MTINKKRMPNLFQTAADIMYAIYTYIWMDLLFV